MNTTTLPTVLNRDGPFAIPEDGWIQLAPLGEAKAPMQMILNGREEDVDVVQVITPQVVDSLVAKFREDARVKNFPGLLVDFDHFSHDEGKSSRAAGWIEEVDSRADGLWGKVRYSASGKAAVEGGDFRLFSPVLGFEPRRYQSGERVSPRVLLRGALTNDPRFRGMVPLSNRQASASATTRNAIQTMDHKSKLLKLLGLPATATDAEIEAAEAAFTASSETRKSDLAAAQNRATTAEARATSAEAELLEHDLNAAGLQGEARSAAKGILTKNRAEGLAFLAAVKAVKGTEPSGYQPTHNRQTAKAPAASGSEAAASTRQREIAVREHMASNRCDFETSWNAVRSTKPDLFKN